MGADMSAIFGALAMAQDTPTWAVAVLTLAGFLVWLGSYLARLQFAKERQDERRRVLAHQARGVLADSSHSEGGPIDFVAEAVPRTGIGVPVARRRWAERLATIGIVVGIITGLIGSTVGIIQIGTFFGWWPAILAAP